MEWWDQKLGVESPRRAIVVGCGSAGGTASSDLDAARSTRRRTEGLGDGYGSRGLGHRSAEGPAIPADGVDLEPTPPCVSVLSVAPC
jgi:hypothetical protein